MYIAQGGMWPLVNIIITVIFIISLSNLIITDANGICPCNISPPIPIGYNLYYDDIDQDNDTCIYMKKYEDSQSVNKRYIRVEIDRSDYSNYTNDELEVQARNCLIGMEYGENTNIKVENIGGVKIAHGRGSFNYNMLDKKLIAIFYKYNLKFIISSNLGELDYDGILRSLNCNERG
jgi:hypothetical protein